MRRALAITAGVVALVGGFGWYTTEQLRRHGAVCDSTLRHCTVPREEIAFLEGDWCLATDPTGLRETFRFEDARILVRQAGERAGGETPWREARVFRSMEALVYFEHDAASGARLTGEMGIVPTSETSRQTSFGPRRVGWVRC